MKSRAFIILAAVLLTGACANTAPTPENAETGANSLPANLIALAAPEQDVASARLNPEDNCYWYEHRGQVETTLLPLTTTEGRPICMQSQA